jgi:hypothetical protein
MRMDLAGERFQVAEDYQQQSGQASLQLAGSLDLLGVPMAFDTTDIRTHTSTLGGHGGPSGRR